METKICETVAACEDTIATCKFLQGSMDILAELSGVNVTLPSDNDNVPDNIDNVELSRLLLQRQQLDERIEKVKKTPQTMS